MINNTQIIVEITENLSIYGTFTEFLDQVYGFFYGFFVLSVSFFGLRKENFRRIRKIRNNSEDYIIPKTTLLQDLIFQSIMVKMYDFIHVEYVTKIKIL